MIFTKIQKSLVANALSSLKFNHIFKDFIRHFNIILIYAGLLALNTNAKNIPSLGSSKKIYSGLFHISLIDLLMDCFININKKYNPLNGLINTYIIILSIYKIQ
jgi:hypothetical protein